MSRPEDIAGPYIVWENNGVEGWSPTSFKTLAEAICHQRYCSEWELTLKADWITSDDGKLSIEFNRPKPPR